jgi:hypothetical protein
MSWARQRWKERPVTDAELPRAFAEGSTRLPYVRDLMDIAAKDQPQDAILVLTNADTIISSDGTLRIVSALQHRDVTYGFRRDWYHHVSAPPADRDFAKGADYPGSDLHACRVRWWLAYRSLWPDLLLGREAWDWCMRVLMEATCMAKPLSLPDIICHERHASHWENPTVRYKLKSQLHNLSLAKTFLDRYNVNSQAGAYNIRIK